MVYTISTRVTLICLSDYLGFGNNVLKFMKLYLSDRTQCVQMNGILSETTKSVCIIVPQQSLVEHLQIFNYAYGRYLFIKLT